MGKHLGKLGIEGKTMQQSNPKLFLNSNKRIWGFLEEQGESRVGRDRKERGGEET